MSEVTTMTMQTRASILGLSTLGLLLGCGLVGCGLEPIEEGGEGGEEAIPAEVQAAFDQSCATSSGCHGAGSSLVVLEAPESAGILDGAQSTNGGAFVTLGSIEDSYIAQKILGGPNISGATMPPSMQSANDDANTALIVGWIAGVDLEGDAMTGDGDGDPTGDGDGDPGTTCYISEVPELPSFATDVWPIIEARCGCHSEFASPSMADASAHVNLVSVTANGSDLPYVEPDSPDGSYLWHKIVGTHTSPAAMGTGTPMPPSGGLCAIEFQAIYAWINAGAAP